MQNVYICPENHGLRSEGHSLPLFLDQLLLLTTCSHITEAYNQDILLGILHRLERLEDHCRLDRDAEDPRDAYPSSMSVSSDDSDITGPNNDKIHTPTTRGVVATVLNRINDQGARSFIRSNVFNHLAHVKSRFFENERCIEAIDSAMTEIECVEDTHAEGQPAFGISKELAKKWIHRMFYSRLMLTKHLPADSSVPVKNTILDMSLRGFGFPWRRISLWLSRTYWKFLTFN